MIRNESEVDKTKLKDSELDVEEINEIVDYLL